MELATRGEVEMQFLREANKLSAKHRKEFLELVGRPPDIRNVPQTFWDKVKREEEELLAAWLLLIVMENATAHGLPEFMAKQRAVSYVNQNAGNVAKAFAENSYAKFLVFQKQRMADGLVDIKVGDIKFEANRVFGPARNDSLISTEFTRASVAGGEEAMAYSGLISENDTWVTRPWLTATGPCELCEPLDGKPRKIWVRLYPSGPPVHPRCACAIQYEQS